MESEIRLGNCPSCKLLAKAIDPDGCAQNIQELEEKAQETLYFAGISSSCMDKEEGLRDQIDLLDEDNYRLRAAPKNILNVLETGACSENKCQGCQVEVSEAIAEARDAVQIRADSA